MVVWGSEFGRTPLGENRPGRSSNTGRDHHPFAFTMLLAGGGIKGGQVYGRSDEIGWGIALEFVILPFFIAVEHGFKNLINHTITTLQVRLNCVANMPM